MIPEKPRAQTPLHVNVNVNVEERVESERPERAGMASQGVDGGAPPATSPIDKMDAKARDGGHPKYFASDPTELGLSVSAVVWREDRVLLMRRSDNGRWGIPGGFVEVGESVAEAARREVAEETGWVVEIEGLIGVYSEPETSVVDYGQRKGAGPGGTDRRIQVVNLCFAARALTPGTPTTPDETLDLDFFAPSALPDPFVPIHAIRLEDGLARRAEAAIR